MFRRSIVCSVSLPSAGGRFFAARPLTRPQLLFVGVRFSSTGGAPSDAPPPGPSAPTSSPPAPPASSSSTAITAERFGTKNTQIIKSTQDTDIVRIKLMPLMLIEEVPLPQRIFTDLELLMMSWSQEQAVKIFYILLIIRVTVALGLLVMFYLFYRSRVALNRKIRGADNVPTELKVGSVVYFDMEYGSQTGRLVIGLLNEQCPLYCEAFHRRCTASGGSGESFRGMKLTALIPRTAAIFGDGRGMTHEVPGFNPSYLPTESQSGPFRGALSSIPLTHNQHTMNFAIHMCGGDTRPQIFGLILGGYDILDAMTKAGVAHQCRPLKDFIITNCGELCTLDKAAIVPMPWDVYESVSSGYDEERWGPRFKPKTAAELAAAAAAAEKLAAASRRPWWKFW